MHAAIFRITRRVANRVARYHRAQARKLQEDRRYGEAESHEKAAEEIDRACEELTELARLSLRELTDALS